MLLSDVRTPGKRIQRSVAGVAGCFRARFVIMADFRMQQSEILEPFEWDKTLSVGSKNMDKDHAELFEAIAQCDGERNSNPGLCKMRALFKLHFEAEEAWDWHYQSTGNRTLAELSQMNEARYRGLAHHQLEHQQFIDRLMEVRLPFTDSFIAEAKHWLVHHIKTTDKAFKDWKE